MATSPRPCPPKRSKLIPVLPLDTEEEESHSHLPLPLPPPKPAPPVEQGEREEEEEDDDDEEDERHRVWDLFSDEYHDIVTELPLEFQRNFHLIRELEDSQQNATNLLQSLLQNYITSLTASSTEPTSVEPSSSSAKESFELISKTARAAIRAGEDKVGLAVTLYESVDRHIRRLDASLTSSSDSLLLGLRPGTTPSHDAPQGGRKEKESNGTNINSVARNFGEVQKQKQKQKQKQGQGQGQGGQGQLKETRTEKRERERRRKREERRKAAVLAAAGGGAATGNGKKGKAGILGMKGSTGAKPHVPSHFVETVDLAFDPTEPTYCYCDRVSFGDMIGCENEDCPREWFHMECVGLSAAPSGVWFCKDCQPKSK